MIKNFRLPAFLCMGTAMLFAVSCTEETPTDEVDDEQSQTLDPFKNHRDSVPSKSQYDAPLYELSHDYPTTVTPVVDPSWQQALGGEPISSTNALAYMDSLKSHIAPNLKPFFEDNKSWKAADHGWYNSPWLGDEREAILGAFLGNGNPANMFESLKVDEHGYAVVLYDETAGYTIGKIWNETGTSLNLVDDAAQFEEGAIIVKLAFSNINASEWAPMEGAETFSIYDTIATGENPETGYQMRTVSFFQMDVIVKDSKTAPKTGWVYSTFVYDMDFAGDYWEKMVPLGAMWGNDPDVNSSVNPDEPLVQPLSETVINPDAPFYSKETLGWGGRLSGPNDGAVALNVTDKNGTVYPRLAVSSCMSCHLTAQDDFVANLLPMDGNTAYVPGGSEWSKWFRDLKGNEPFTEGEIALDYGMVTALGAIPTFKSATKPKDAVKHITKNVNAIRASRRLRK